MKSDAQRIAAIREAIARVEQEPCACRHLATLKCLRCQHLEHLREELREAEGAR